MQSSLSSIVGGLGLAAYSAANLFIDAFANSTARTVPWFSVNWDACRAEEEGKKAGVGASVAELAMTLKEVWNASRRILSMGSASQVIVSKVDLQARIDEWIKLTSSQATESLKDSKQGDLSSHHSRPNLPNTYVTPRNEIEQNVANIWQELLGIEQVGVYDNFFELGGHSLLAIQIISRLRETFQVELPMRSILFDAHTIAGLAAVIAENQTKQEDLQEMAELLKEVKSLSPEEIQEELAVGN